MAVASRPLNPCRDLPLFFFAAKNKRGEKVQAKKSYLKKSVFLVIVIHASGLKEVFMRRKILFLTLFVSLVLPLFLTAGEKELLSVDLFLDWEDVSSPQISPDGKQIVYSRRWVDKVNDSYAGEIWIMNIDGGKKRFLLKGSSPQWSPDGYRSVRAIDPGGRITC